MTAASPSPTSEDEARLVELASRVDAAASAVAGMDVGSTRIATELREAVEAFHREGLGRILRTIREHENGDALLAELSQDRFVAALFHLHALVKPGLDQRVEEGLRRARPLLHQHGGDVEFVRRDDDVVHLRLLGACSECTLGPLTLRNAVTDAVLKEAPEIRSVRLVEEEPKPVIEHPGEGWQRGPDLAEIPEGRGLRCDLEQDSIILYREGETLQAWVNLCPHKALKIDGGLHDRDSGLELSCPWHGWRFDLMTGVCVNNPTADPLTPVPLIQREGTTWLHP